MPDFDDEVLNRPIPKPRRTKAQIAADNAAAAAKKSTKTKEAKLKQGKKDLAHQEHCHIGKQDAQQ